MKNIFSILSVVLIILAGCSQPKNADKSKSDHVNANTKDQTFQKDAQMAQLISEPLPTAKKAPIVFSIDPTKDQVLKTETGSKIIIPKNAFVDKNGKPLTGKVDIKFEEFHDASDIILSGIPMNITTKEGEEASFESAGMFRIEGSQAGKEISIANNKTIEISMASNQVGDDFNFYEFSESEGSWEEKGQAIKAVANEDKKLALMELGPEPIKPLAIKKATNNDLVFDIAVDESRNPEFASINNLMWKSIDQNTDKSLFDGTIRLPRLECVDQVQSIFRLTGASATGRMIDTKVQPVLFGKNWEKANASFKLKMKKYNEAVVDRTNAKARAEKMRDQTRAFSLSNFGVFNFDRLYHLKRKVQFNALFFVPALHKVFKEGFLIQGKKKVAIPYTNSGYYKFTFDPEQENTVVTIDEDGNLYEFSAENFTAINDLEISSEETYTFQMRHTDIRIQNASDLTDYLAKL